MFLKTETSFKKTLFSSEKYSQQIEKQFEVIVNISNTAECCLWGAAVRLTAAGNPLHEEEADRKLLC